MKRIERLNVFLIGTIHPSTVTYMHTTYRIPTATGPPRPCRALIITTHGTRALLPLFLPNLPHPSAGAANYDDQLLLASILIPGASLSGNRACSASHPGNAGCFLYRASLPSEEKEEDAVLVCACNVEAPLEVSRRENCLLGLLRTGEAARPVYSMPSAWLTTTQ